MFNPLCLLSEKLLDAFVKSGKKYFVRQTYDRGINLADKDIKGCFLISHYSDLHDARQHYEALSADTYRFLYDWHHPEDQKRLKLAAAQPEGYKVFASVVMPDWQKRAEKMLKAKVRSFVTARLKWFPARNDAVDFDLYPHFGEIFVKMSFRNQEIKVALSEVEKISSLAGA